MKTFDSLVLMSAIFGMRLDGHFYFPNPKEQKKCILPSCANLTSHNGGYCSAAHKKEHAKKP